MSTSKDSVSINRKYKDRLFCMLFGDEQHKENILSLYNALNGTAYTNANDIEITTIEDAIYIKMKNDVSFLVDSYLSLWEQQSTYNPNLPLRGLMYFGNLYDSYIEQHKLNIYGRKLIKIPTPQYVVLYNGTENRKAIEELRLSDAFQHPDKSGYFEWTVKVININEGCNSELLKQCKPLSEYMTLINKIRAYQKTDRTIEDAVDTAVKECIKEGVLADFLLKHRTEVLSVCLNEFNEKVFTDGIREEGREEGRKEGRLATLMELVADGSMPISKAAEKAMLSIEDFSLQMKNNGYKL